MFRYLHESFETIFIFTSYPISSPRHFFINLYTHTLSLSLFLSLCFSFHSLFRAHMIFLKSIFACLVYTPVAIVYIYSCISSHLSIYLSTYLFIYLYIWSNQPSSAASLPLSFRYLFWYFLSIVISLTENLTNYSCTLCVWRGLSFSFRGMLLVSNQ